MPSAAPVPAVTISKRLTKADVKEAIASVGKAERTWSDTQSKGLSLRVRKASATWVLRARLGPRQSTWRVADARQAGDPDIVRQHVAEAWSLIARGIDPGDRLRELEHGGPVERTFDAKKDGWTWEQARDAYLLHVEADKSAATYRDYRVTLRSADLQVLCGLLAKQVTPERAKAIQDSIYSRGKTAQARHTTAVLKTCLAWVADRAGSGLSESPVASVRVMSARLAPPEDGRVPTAAEIGELPWRLEAAPISLQSRLAGLLILFTAQRIATVLSARKEDFEPAEGGRGGIWTIPRVRMKAKRGHVIPIPPATWDIVRQAAALSKTPQGWLFPQARPRRAGGAVNGHISYNPVARPLDPLDPHDLRRAFATHGQVRLGMRPSDTKAILDHAEGRGGDVTAARYALHDGQHFKWRLMQDWEAWVLAQIRASRPGARLRTLLLDIPTVG